MRILVCGSRTWTDSSIVWAMLDSYNHSDWGTGLVVIHGAARGADELAHKWCILKDDELIVEKGYPADWDRYGKRAGYVRNAQMLEEGKPDLVLGFMNEPSPGTTMMLNLAKKAGIPTYRIQVW